MTTTSLEPIGSGATPAQPRVAGTEHAAHARLLEERPTGTAGEPFPLLDVLITLESGQFVNCGTNQTPPESEAAHLLRVLDGPLSTAQPPSDVLPTGRWAAQVLLVRVNAAQVLVGVPSVPDGVERNTPITLDFTDVTGTYLLHGTVEEVRTGDQPYLVIRCVRATRLQLRRFVRVPVLIAPLTLSVQAAPGEWREVSGQVVDVSLGGVGLLVSEPLFGDGHVRITFDLPGRFGALETRGRVVEPPGPAEALSARRAGQPLAHRRGVAFEPLSVADLRRLQRALYHRQVELRRLSAGPLERYGPVTTEPSEPSAATAGWRRWLPWTR